MRRLQEGSVPGSMVAHQAVWSGSAAQRLQAERAGAWAGAGAGEGEGEGDACAALEPASQGHCLSAAAASEAEDD